MRKVLFITNIPVPYRVDFYNELGKYVDLTVIFEADGASNQGIVFDWNIDTISNFKPIFLKKGDIKEKQINFKIFKYLKVKQYDDIIVTSYSYFTEMAALIYLKLIGASYYMETDGGLIREESSIKRLYKKFLVSGAKGYFSPSQESDKYLVYYGADKNKVYRYPFTSLKEKDVLTNTLSNEVKSEYKKKLGMIEPKIILGVGQFIHRKGWDVLLEAAKLLPNDIGIYIVGSEATSEYLNKKKEWGLENVHFEGFKTKLQLKDYYCAADVFVLPTREDIWGLVVNEALSFGLPVITTDKCNAGLELIKENMNGLVINSDNAIQLKKAIELLFNESDLQQYGKKALSVAEEYTIENMAKRHLEIFNEIDSKKDKS